MESAFIGFEIIVEIRSSEYPTPVTFHNKQITVWSPIHAAPY